MNRPPIKDKEVQKYVEELEQKLSKYDNSPISPTYMAIYKQIQSWNSQLSANDIDLFADKDQKEFDRAWKYFMESLDVLKRLDEMRKLMTPEEAKQAEKELKAQSLGMAEKIALNAQNGKG